MLPRTNLSRRSLSCHHDCLAEFISFQMSTITWWRFSEEDCTPVLKRLTNVSAHVQEMYSHEPVTLRCKIAWSTFVFDFDCMLKPSLFLYFYLRAHATVRPTLFFAELDILLPSWNWFFFYANAFYFAATHVETCNVTLILLPLVFLFVALYKSYKNHFFKLIPLEENTLQIIF